MTVYRLIAPQWAVDQGLRRVREGQFTSAELEAFNAQGYNVYYLPNYPSKYEGGTVEGSQIDAFEWCYVDMDLKDGVYASKDAFIEALTAIGGDALTPTRIIDSGGGVHVYWRVNGLDAKSYLRFQRRLLRLFKTDEAVGQIYQLMRVPGTINTKDPDNLRYCEEIFTSDTTYTCEQFHSLLPPILPEDEEYCNQHYAKTFEPASLTKIDEEIPHKFNKLISASKEVREIWRGNVDDRSGGDYRLAHIMHAEGFTREEALSVLVNCQKAISRSPKHRISYAENIVDKVWVFEAAPGDHIMSSSVRDILRRGSAIQGTRFPCWEVYDGTHHGFHLTEVLGLIGGAGSGKTTLALNYFYWFAKRNPEYIHLFVSLEQQEEEIALRWARIVGANESLHDRVHVLSNYNADGSYRNLSLHEIETYTLDLQKRLGVKIGCVVMDHIGVLKKQGKEGEAQGLIDICHNMKAFAKRTNTFLVMQSQTSREKAGIGDLELDKDAAYGTSMFEWYCDYVVTTWQPLKRVYDQAPHMTCSAFKYCKIRHKNVKLDKSKEDVVHVLMYDTDTELLSQMTQKHETAYEHYNSIATKIRNRDRKREPTKVTRIEWTGKEVNGKIDNNQGLSGSPKPDRVSSG